VIFNEEMVGRRVGMLVIDTSSPSLSCYSLVTVLFSL